MLPLVDEAKRSSRGREIEIYIQMRKDFVRTRLFLDFLKIFSLKNERFGILKNKKGHFLIFFFLKNFSSKNEGFVVLKNEKGYFLIF